MNKPESRRIFDWHKAARYLKENAPQTAEAYLKTQRESTGGVIWKNCRPFYDSYTFLQSDLDLPMMDADGVQMECWRFVNDGVPDEFWKKYQGGVHYRCLGKWRYSTKWPDSALQIVGFPEEKEGI